MMQIQTNSNTQNDDAFMTLLSSQRELLCQLKQERDSAASKADLPKKVCMQKMKNKSSKKPYASKPKNKRTLEKRDSLGLGTDTLVLLSTLEYEPMTTDTSKSKNNGKRKKRRISSMGFLSSSFFEDCVQSRRNSLVSVVKQCENESKRLFDVTEAIYSSISDDHNELPDPIDLDVVRSDDAIAKEDIDTEETDEDNRTCAVEHEKPNVDPELLKVTFDSFSSAMDKSQQSQQDIHSWDRKMGLKRSHSKTMRLSSRSRKKLKAFFRCELSMLVAEARATSKE